MSMLIKKSPILGEAAYTRRDMDAYFTIDAGWIVPALLSHVQLRGPVYEPAAGEGHLVDALTDAGYNVTATELGDYGRSDIQPGIDLFELGKADFAGHGSVVCNLPYNMLDRATAHLLSIALPLGMQVASLVRAEWHIAKSRQELVHRNPHFAGMVFLTKRPRWVLGSSGSPRHWYAWAIWDGQKQSGSPFTAYAGELKQFL